MASSPTPLAEGTLRISTPNWYHHYAIPGYDTPNMSPHASKEVTDCARSKAQGDETGIARSMHSDASRSLFADVETRSEGSMDGVEFTTSGAGVSHDGFQGNTQDINDPFTATSNAQGPRSDGLSSNIGNSLVFTSQPFANDQVTNLGSPLTFSPEVNAFIAGYLSPPLPTFGPIYGVVTSLQSTSPDNRPQRSQWTANTPTGSSFGSQELSDPVRLRSLIPPQSPSFTATNESTTSALNHSYPLPLTPSRAQNGRTPLPSTPTARQPGRFHGENRKRSNSFHKTRGPQTPTSILHASAPSGSYFNGFGQDSPVVLGLSNFQSGFSPLAEEQNRLDKLQKPKTTGSSSIPGLDGAADSPQSSTFMFGSPLPPDSPQLSAPLSTRQNVQLELEKGLGSASMSTASIFMGKKQILVAFNEQHAEEMVKQLGPEMLEHVEIQFGHSMGAASVSSSALSKKQILVAFNDEHAEEMIKQLGPEMLENIEIRSIHHLGGAKKQVLIAFTKEHAEDMNKRLPASMLNNVDIQINSISENGINNETSSGFTLRNKRRPTARPRLHDATKARAVWEAIYNHVPKPGSGHKSKPLKNFWLFKFLPVEIRQMVWKLCIPYQRVIAMETTMFCRKEIFVDRNKVPAVLQVCHHSREVAKTVLKPRFETSYLKMAYTWMHMETDVLRLNDIFTARKLAHARDPQIKAEREATRHAEVFFRIKPTQGFYFSLAQLILLAPCRGWYSLDSWTFPGERGAWEVDADPERYVVIETPKLKNESEMSAVMVLNLKDCINQEFKKARMRRNGYWIEAGLKVIYMDD